MRLGPTQKKLILRLFKFVARLAEEAFPGCGVYCFGSATNGLGTRHSDVDIHLDLEHQLGGDGSQLLLTKKMKFLQLEQMLVQNKGCAHVHPIPNAKVPVIKFLHRPTGLAVDLSFKNMMGIYNSQFIRFCTRLDPRMEPLFMTIKYILKHQARVSNQICGETNPIRNPTFKEIESGFNPLEKLNFS